jgi:hypothetical protein
VIRRYGGKFEVSAGWGAGAGVAPDAAGAVFELGAGTFELPGFTGCIGGTAGSLGAAALGVVLLYGAALL